jgi:sugar O-acyltransferase (sialic acid O-acetyltransferase NeuD family)
METIKDLILIGGGEQSKVIVETAASTPDKWNVLGFIDNDKSTRNVSESHLLRLGLDSDISLIRKKYPSAQFVLAMGDISAREKIVDRLNISSDKWAILIHASAEISPSAKLSHGVVVLSRAVIQASSIIEKHAVINSGSIVEHDVVIEKFVHISPGVVVGGGCKIRRSSFIGLGSRIRDHIIIGSSVIIGAGSAVVSDIPDNETAIGIPASRLSEAKSYMGNIQEICVHEDISLYEAMSILSEYATKIIFITSSQSKLLGVLTYGDIKSALLDYDSLSHRIGDYMNTNFHYIDEQLNRIFALDYMKSNGIDRMPIVDSDMNVVGMHTIESIVGNLKITNPVVIMAGGKGTRLKPITDTIPKPMVKVAGRPILEHIIFHLSGSGIEDISISVNYLKDIIRDHFQNGSRFGCHIKYLVEDEPLGTAGSLSKLPITSDKPVIVLNGDIISHFDVDSLLRTHETNNNVLTIGTHQYKVDIPYGVIETDNDRVVDICEKPQYRYLINAGVYVINPDIISSIPINEKEFHMTDLIDSLANSNKKIGVHLLDSDWIDIGRQQDLIIARGES